MNDKSATVRPLPFVELPDTFFEFLDRVEGLSDATVMRLIDRHYPEAAAFLREPPTRDQCATDEMIRRAVDIPTLRLLTAARDVDDETDEESAWPPPPIEGEPIPLPGFDEVAERPEEGRKSWTG